MADDKETVDVAFYAGDIIGSYDSGKLSNRRYFLSK